MMKVVPLDQVVAIFEIAKEYIKEEDREEFVKRIKEVLKKNLK